MPIKSLWQFVKKDLAKYRYYQKYKTFWANVFRCLNNFEEISVLNEVYGRYDLVLKIDCEDSKTMEEFMQNNINTMDDIQQAETLVVAETEDGYDEDVAEESD